MPGTVDGGSGAGREAAAAIADVCDFDDAVRKESINDAEVIDDGAPHVGERLRHDRAHFRELSQYSQATRDAAEQRFGNREDIFLGEGKESELQRALRRLRLAMISSRETVFPAACSRRARSMRC